MYTHTIYVFEHTIYLYVHTIYVYEHTVNGFAHTMYVYVLQTYKRSSKETTSVKGRSKWFTLVSMVTTSHIVYRNM